MWKIINLCLPIVSTTLLLDVDKKFSTNCNFSVFLEAEIKPHLISSPASLLMNRKKQKKNVLSERGGENEEGKVPALNNAILLVVVYWNHKQ